MVPGRLTEENFFQVVGVKLQKQVDERNFFHMVPPTSPPPLNGGGGFHRSRNIEELPNAETMSGVEV